MRTYPILASLFAVLLWAVYLVGTRLVFSGTRIDPFAYALTQMLSGGAFMILLSGRARVDWADLLNFWTVAFGGLRTVVISATALALLYLPVVQTSLLGTMSVPLATLAEWRLRRVVPSRLELLGNVLLLLAILAIVASLPGGRTWIGLGWQILSETSAVASGVIAWRHPANQGDSIAVRARTTGVLLAASALSTALGWWAMAGAGLAADPFASGAGALGDPELWLYGAAAGILVRGPGTYISLYVYRYAGISTHMAGLTAIPLAAIGLEQVAIGFGWLPAVAFGVVELAAMSLVLVAAAILIRAKTRRA